MPWADIIATTEFTGVKDRLPALAHYGPDGVIMQL